MKTVVFAVFAAIGAAIISGIAFFFVAGLSFLTSQKEITPDLIRFYTFGYVMSCVAGAAFGFCSTVGFRIADHLRKKG